MCKNQILLVKNNKDVYFLTYYCHLLDAMTHQSFKIFGMDIKSLIEMKKQYFIHGGKPKITVESIRKVFKKVT